MTGKIKIFVCLFFTAALFKGQQQGLYTNFLLHQYVYNPACIGVVQGERFNIGYRSQWTGFEGAPKTALVSGYGNFRKRPNMAVGGMIFNERIGLIDLTSFSGLYSYRLQINKTAALSFGLSAGGVQYSVKAFNARPYDKDDSYISSGLLNAFAFDAGAGVYFTAKNFFFGFSNQHMANSKISWPNSLGKLSPHYYTYLGYNFIFGEKKEWEIQPSFLLRRDAPSPYQAEMNLKTTYQEKLWLGFNYRYGASASISAGCLIDKQFTVAYAYDFTTSELSNYNSGSHEVLLSYFIPYKKKKSKAEQIQDADEQELNTTDNGVKTNLKGKKKDEEQKEPEKQKEK